MSEGIMSYPPSWSRKDQNLLRACHFLSALCTEPSAHHGSKDAALNYKKNDCILFSCNPGSHNKSCVHQMASRKITCNSNTILRCSPSTLPNHCSVTGQDLSPPFTPTATNLQIFQTFLQFHTPPEHSRLKPHSCPRDKGPVLQAAALPPHKPLAHLALLLWNCTICQQHH